MSSIDTFMRMMVQQRHSVHPNMSPGILAVFFSFPFVVSGLSLLLPSLCCVWSESSFPSPCCVWSDLRWLRTLILSASWQVHLQVLHAGVSGNEQADRLASTADITSGLQLGRAEVLRGLRIFLNTDKPEHHSTDCLKKRGVEKGSGRHSTLRGRERSVFNQANIGTVSRATLGRLLRDGAERVWAFPSATMPS